MVLRPNAVLGKHLTDTRDQWTGVVTVISADRVTLRPAEGLDRIVGPNEFNTWYVWAGAVEPYIAPTKEFAPPLITSATGGMREAAKLPYHLIPPKWIRWIAAVFAEGAVKYGDRNWEKGLPTDTYLDHMEEHLLRFKEGDRTEDHLSKIAWGALALKWTEEKYGSGGPKNGTTDDTATRSSSVGTDS